MKKYYAIWGPKGFLVRTKFPQDIENDIMMHLVGKNASCSDHSDPRIAAEYACTQHLACSKRGEDKFNTNNVLNSLIVIYSTAGVGVYSDPSKLKDAIKFFGHNVEYREVPWSASRAKIFAVKKYNYLIRRKYFSEGLYKGDPEEMKLNFTYYRKKLAGYDDRSEIGGDQNE